MTAPRGTDTGSGSTGGPDGRGGAPRPAAGEVTADRWTPRAGTAQPTAQPNASADTSALEQAARQLTQRVAVETEASASSSGDAAAGTTTDGAEHGGLREAPAPARSGSTSATPGRPGEAPHDRDDLPPAVPRAGRSGSPGDSTAGPEAAGSGWAPAAEAGEGPSGPTSVLPGGPGAGSVRRPPPARPAPPRPGVARTDVRPTAARPGAARTRRARLALRRLDPWSVFVFSLIASLFVGVALVVAVAVLYTILGSLGVTQSLNQLFVEVTGGSASGDPLLTGSRIIGGAAVLAAVNVVLLTLLATLAALLYNVCASFTGGIELTLGERD